jgi:hypothetical protein
MRADHVERLLRQVVALAVDDHLEARMVSFSGTYLPASR